MSTQGTIKRYHLTVEKVANAIFPSFEEIKSYLHDQGFEISPRTLQRDIEQVRNEFGVEIKYDRAKNGYYIDKEDSLNLESFLRFLEMMVTANIIADCLKDGRDNMNYLNFESKGNLRGIEYLKDFLLAIRTQRVVNFTHENFQTEKRKKVIMKPYLLKEYRNRWYVIGNVEGIKEFRIYGIDRITELIVTKEKFKLSKSTEVIDLFENTIGLLYDEHELQEVHLAFEAIEAKYVKSLPWHQSQVLLSENTKETVFKLNITPNYELKQKILMLGANVRVVKPAWLAKEIKEILVETLKQYK